MLKYLSQKYLLSLSSQLFSAVKLKYAEPSEDRKSLAASLPRVTVNGNAPLRSSIVGAKLTVSDSVSLKPPLHLP